MACRGCVNLQCNCFTVNSDSTITIGNGSQYAPFTFRPDYIPTPRPFGHLYSLTASQTLDGAPYSLFEPTTPDIDQGGNMRTGNGTSLTVTADGLYLAGFMLPFAGVATADLNDNFSLRRNAIQVATATFAHTSTVIPSQLSFMSAQSLLDLNAGDILDVFVERIAGAGTVNVVSGTSGTTGYTPQLWAVWMGGPI